MKKIKLLKRDAYDLASVVAMIVKEKSEDLDFKDIIHLQKTVNIILESIKDFSNGFEELTKERNTFIEAANKKISGFKSKMMSSVEKAGKVEDADSKSIDQFINLTMENVKVQIEEELGEKTRKLYDVLGAEDCEFEIDEEKQKILISNFEKYAKEKYTNKSKMVEVYEKIS